MPNDNQLQQNQQQGQMQGQMPQYTNQQQYGQQVDPNQQQPNPMSLNRDSSSIMQNNGGMQQQPQQPLPYAAFPADQQRQDYDPNMYQMIQHLIDMRYQNRISPEVKNFELNRAYNKLEIEIYELSTNNLAPDKQAELQKMNEEAQNSVGNKEEFILKIRSFMESNVPNITQQVDEYIKGFQNQYLAGRY